MIKIDTYGEFEEEYWLAVKKYIDKKTQKEIIKSCIKFLPDDFFEEKKISFKHLVLAPFHKLKSAYDYIEHYSYARMQQQCFCLPLTDEDVPVFNKPYEMIHDAYEKVSKSQKNKTTMGVRMLRRTKLTVCPYCNRDYINCRSDDTSGAQLDHFLNRSCYPVFAVCLYNLVPVCANCNRIKSKKTVEFASPFDESIDWERAVVFSYDPKSNPIGKVVITAEGIVENNIREMKIRQAYQIHDEEVRDLLERKEYYSKSQMKEFQEVFKTHKVSDEKIKQIVFGKRITQEDMKKKPLGKMMHDLHKELNIYI